MHIDLRRIDSRLSLLYKITNRLVEIPKTGHLIPIPRTSRYSHPHCFRLITATTDYYKYSFFPRTVFHWNNLPPDIPTLPTLKQFNAAVSSIEHVSS